MVSICSSSSRIDGVSSITKTEITGPNDGTPGAAPGGRTGSAGGLAEREPVADHGGGLPRHLGGGPGARPVPLRRPVEGAEYQHPDHAEVEVGPDLARRPGVFQQRPPHVA